MSPLVTPCNRVEPRYRRLPVSNVTVSCPSESGVIKKSAFSSAANPSPNI